VTTPTLLALIEQGRLDPTPFATHRFARDDTMAAYDVFGNAAETNALKVVVSAERAPLAARELAAAGAVR
jgi:alcohol dehydrogenase